jgi:hypothetical protein
MHCTISPQHANAMAQEVTNSNNRRNENCGLFRLGFSDQVDEVNCQSEPAIEGSLRDKGRSFAVA